MQEHKTKLLKNHKNNDINGIIEVLLSLRVNALQIAPELRKNLVYELIRNDIFDVENKSVSFIIRLLKIKNPQLKHATCSLVSVISSTLKGVEYLTQDGQALVLKELMKVPLPH